MPASKAAQANKQRNRLVAQIGMLTARGMTAEQIAIEVANEVTPPQIELAWQQLGISPVLLHPGLALVDVAMSAKHRTKLAREGTSRGMELPALCAALLGKATDDDLIVALLDG
ncbi:hypothetical protein [Devosia sp. RR2S18]|uniref:hypothetical protein n=1 Tax=Devosia rhizosphaerae TaxID=3049774 RepID=UPI002541469B|nr:hypothetical protein [Devosia sp. RR2S18]WIJ26598.1 hypothetical protein QOV41_07560 [Devosia sp. RR2S18]